MGIVLDSSVLIDLERTGIDPRRLTEQQEEQLLITAVSVSELQYGLYKAESETQKHTRGTFIASLLETLPVLPFDVSAALVHARVWSELTAIGQRVGVQDSMIAATALANDHAVMTSNIREFSRVIGLEIRAVSLS